MKAALFSNNMEMSEMNPAESTLLELLKNTLRQNTITAQQGQEWDAVFVEAQMQSVTALAAKALPAEMNAAEKQCWTDALYRQIAAYVRYVAAQDQLCRLFRDNGIPMAILKGAAAAVYYPQPSLRAMGDIDFLVEDAFFSQAEALLTKNGYLLSHQDDGRHVSFGKDGTAFEMHHSFSGDIDALLMEGLQQTAVAAVDGHEFPMLPRFANGLVLLVHMRMHLRGGIGLRQLIDWMMYVRCELDDAFWKDVFYPVAKEKNLDVLAVTATRACQKYLGLTEEITWCSGADEQLCEEFIENVLFTGNFGSKNGSGGNVERVMTKMMRAGFFQSLQHSGESNWTSVRKHPWLRPFAWFYQFFRYSRQLFWAKRGSKVLDDYQRSRKRLEMLEKLHIR